VRTLLGQLPLSPTAPRRNVSLVLKWFWQWVGLSGGDPI
jgi:hypothetical protein